MDPPEHSQPPLASSAPTQAQAQASTSASALDTLASTLTARSPSPTHSLPTSGGIQSHTSASETTTTTTTSSSNKRRRVRTGCLTCRQRKVKCGEEKPQCSMCARLSLECSYADERVLCRSRSNSHVQPQAQSQAREPDSEQSHTREILSGTAAAAATDIEESVVDARHKRPIRACEQCRTAKAKCTNEKPMCARCRSQNKQCHYSPSWQHQLQHRRQLSQSQSQSHASESPLGNLVPSSDRLDYRQDSLRDNNDNNDNDNEDVSPSAVQPASTPDVSAQRSFAHPQHQSQRQLHYHSNRPTNQAEREAGAEPVAGHQPLDSAHSDSRETRRAVPQSVAAQTASPAPSLALSDFQSSLGAKANLHSLLELYWDKVYHSSWFPFLHRASFTSALEANTVPAMLLQSMCGAASCFIVSPSSSSSAAAASGSGGARPAGSAEPQDWMTDVEKNLHVGLSSPSLEALQACMHLVFFDQAKGNPTRSFMAIGLASRMAFALRLNVETDRPDLSFAQKESRRRLMWSVFTLDSIFSNGVRDIETVSFESLHIQLPCNERNFALSIACKTRKLRLDNAPGTWLPETAEGLFAQTCALMAIRKKVLSYVVNLSQERSLPWQSGSVFDDCRWHLLNWRNNLGPELQFNNENIAIRRTYGQLGQYFSMHVRYWGVSYNLFRIAVHGFVEAANPEVLLLAPQDWLRSVQRECHQAASAVSNLCQTLLERVPDYCPEDPSLAITLYESLRIQAWALDNLIPLEAQPAARAEAAPRINATVDLVMRSKCYFPRAVVMNRLLFRLIGQTQLQHIIDDRFTRSHTTSHTPPEETSQQPALGNLSSTALIYSVHRELAKISRNQTHHSQQHGGISQHEPQRPFPAVPAEQNAQPVSAGQASFASMDQHSSASLPLPVPAVDYLALLGPPLADGSSAGLDVNDWNWMLDNSNALFQVHGMAQDGFGSGPPYDDISAMLDWQWPLANT